MSEVSASSAEDCRVSPEDCGASGCGVVEACCSFFLDRDNAMLYSKS